MNRFCRIAALFALGVASFYASQSFAQTDSTSQMNWPQFRGASGESSSTSELPVQWTADNYVWRTAIPGKGWSSPVYVDGKKAWMTSAIVTPATKEEIKKKLAGVDFARIKTAAASVEFHAVCVDLESGEILHDIVLGKTDDPQPINPMNSYASPSPAIADGKVVCHFGAYGTWCLDVETGEELWNTQYVIQHSVGAGSSPVIVDGHVVLVCDGMEQQFVAAVDLNSGEEVWKTSRPPIKATNGEFRKSYCTPIIREIDGRKQVIVTGADWLCAYDPTNGEEIWRLNFGKGYSITGMPLLVDGLVVFVTGYDLNQMVAMKPGAGELDSSVIKWKSNGAPAMASILVHEGVIYSANDRGVLSAINPGDGQVINKVRTIGNLSSSPLVSGGKLYIGNRDGELQVVTADEKLELVFNYNFGSPIYSSPSPLGNDLLIRTADELIRISSKD